MHRITAYVLTAFCVAAALQSARASTANIRETPQGDRILFVDGDSLRKEPGGKRLLFIDGDSLRPEPGGKRLLFIDGDNIRPDPHGIRLLFIDGQNIRRNPHSDRLLFIDGDNIRPDPNGKRLLFIDGKIDRAQLIAVLFYLKPELFKLSAEEEARLKKEMADNEAATEAEAKKDTLPGKYSFLSFSSTDDRKAAGTITAEKKGDFYKLAFNNTKTNEKWEGVGYKYVINGDTEMWCVLGPEGTTALAVYEADANGVLNGKWAPCYLLDDPASFGTEQLTPAGENKFTITQGKAPKTGAPYAGTCDFTPAKMDINGDGKAFDVEWTMGEYKVKGVACRYKNHVVIAGSTGKVYDIVRFKVSNGSTAGDLRSNGGATGFYTLMKEE